MSSLGKQQSASTSAISTAPNNVNQQSPLQMSPQQINVQNKVMSPRSGPKTNLYVSPTQQQSIPSPPSPTVVSSSPSTTLHHQQQSKQLGQQHLHHQSVHKSPKKSTSLPTPVAPSMLSSPPASKVCWGLFQHRIYTFSNRFVLS